MYRYTFLVYKNDFWFLKRPVCTKTTMGINLGILRPVLSRRRRQTKGKRQNARSFFKIIFGALQDEKLGGRERCSQFRFPHFSLGSFSPPPRRNLLRSHPSALFILFFFSSLSHQSYLVNTNEPHYQRYISPPGVYERREVKIIATSKSPRSLVSILV